MFIAERRRLRSDQINGVRSRARIILDGYDANITNAPSGSALTSLGSVANVYTKLAGTTVLGSGAVDFTMPANNRLQYTGSVTKNFRVSGDIGLSVSSTTPVYAIMLLKNGNTNITQSYRKIQFSNSGGLTMPFSFTVSLAKDEYIEIFAANNGTTNPSIRMQALSMLIEEVTTY